MLKGAKLDSLDIINFMNGLVFYAPVALLVRTSAGISVSMFFALQALFSLCVLCLEIPTGKVTDMIGYKKSIIFSQSLLLFSRCLLLVAFINKNIVMFVIEAMIEAMASCFSSGTQSAYLYTVYDAESYVVKSAHVANCGTTGFVISTIAYAGLYALTGLKGLLIATIFANMIGTIAAFELKSDGMERKVKIKESDHRLIRELCCKESFFFMLALSCFSIGFILINFFYVDKLQMLQLKEEILTPIILGYSLLELLSERILNKFSGKAYIIVFSLSLLMAGIFCLLFGCISNIPLIILIMLFLPLFLDIPSLILEEFQNKFVDKIGKEEKRAEILSVFNMGVNLFEVVFLFCSSLLSNSGISMCFYIMGFVSIVISIVFLKAYYPVEG